MYSLKEKPPDKLVFTVYAVGWGCITDLRFRLLNVYTFFDIIINISIIFIGGIYYV